MGIYEGELLFKAREARGLRTLIFLGKGVFGK